MSKAPPSSSAAPLAQILAERVDSLDKHVRRALRTGDVEAVHDARVATRRLKAAVDMLRPLLPEGPRSQFAKALRKIRKALGPVRDVDVMLAHVESTRPPRYDDEAAAWVAGRLRERRDDLRRHAGRRGSERKLLSRLSEWDDLEPAVRASEESAARLLAQAAPAQMRAFAERADRQTRTRDPQAAGEPQQDSPEDVHDLRIAGKALRYTLELAAPLGFRLDKSVARQFKKLQDALGLWHDYAVLTDEALRLALDAQLSVRRPCTHGKVLRLANASWRDAERHLDRFRKSWAAQGAALTTGVLSVFPDGPKVAAAEDHPTPPQSVADGNGSEVTISGSS